MIQLASVTGSIPHIAGALHEIRRVEQMRSFRLINSSENCSLQAGELGPCRQRLLCNLCWSVWSGEAALVEAIAQHWNLLPYSYRVAFRFLLAAFGKVWFKVKNIGKRLGIWPGFTAGIAWETRCDSVPAMKALAAPSRWSLVSRGLYLQGVWRIHWCLSVYPWQYMGISLKHLSCTKREKSSTWSTSRLIKLYGSSLTRMIIQGVFLDTVHQL